MRTFVLLASVASLSLGLALACGGNAPPAAAPSAAGSSSAAPSADATSSADGAPATTTTTATTSASAASTENVPRIVGGACTYAKQPGTCEITAGRTFSFTGTVDGAKVVLPGNALGESDKTPAVGAKVPCTIDFIVGGTCTPCMFSLGTCSGPAWDAFRKHK